jgi:hypothetical protein
MQLDGNGNPVIAYTQVIYPQSYVKLLHCGDADCSAGNVTSTVDPSGSGGGLVSLELDSKGNPVISHYDFVATSLKLIHCWTPTCN